jgi:hypothetical protein
VRCLKAGVRVPGLRVVDVKSGSLGVEWIDGWSVREVLGGGQEEDGLPENDEDEEDEDEEEEEDIAELLLAKGVTEGEHRSRSSLLLAVNLMKVSTVQTTCYGRLVERSQRCTSQKSFTEISPLQT